MSTIWVDGSIEKVEAELAEALKTIANLTLERDLAQSCHREASRLLTAAAIERDEALASLEHLRGDRIAELEKQVADLKLDLDARREFQRELNKRTEELKAFEFSLSRYAELEKQLREATEALGPAWLVGRVSLAEGIKRKVDRLEAVESATWGQLEPRCTR